MSTVHYQLWEYNDWANTVYLKLFESYGEKVPASALRFLGHIMNAQTIWLSRIEGDPQSVEPWTEHHRLEEIRTMHEKTSLGLRTAIVRHQDNLSLKIRYTNTKGTAFQNTLSDILLQAFNHGTYHRAQIALELRAHGLEAVNTDFINFIRLSAPQQ
jgi:uncharacterized damage-inducible protein DinB